MQILTLAALALFGAFPVEASPDVQIVELRETIAQIVDVKSQVSAERSGWETRKAEMNELLGLHRRELELLNEELEKSGTSTGDYDARKTEAEQEIAKLKAARRTAGEAVARNRERALALAAMFPKPLAKEAEVERLALEGWKPGDEPRDGLQAILGLVTKAEQFNRRVNRASEVRDGREVEVLYLGLARAYYADRSGNAGIGVPAEGGWKWEGRPELAGEIVKAFDELDRKRPPELVELPVKIQD
ncbi:hypothetical protein Hsar01_00109 [Haloferula sargassicola]|uniref:DUF3450 family protein n=2 Tax=Haloferula sargassicola TaxID=490096 RepID=A0ABP9UHC1_9BACT